MDADALKKDRALRGQLFQGKAGREALEDQVFLEDGAADAAVLIAPSASDIAPLSEPPPEAGREHDKDPCVPEHEIARQNITNIAAAEEVTEGVNRVLIASPAARDWAVPDFPPRPPAV